MGGTRLQWEDQMRKDLKRRGARTWADEERQEWMPIVGEAKKHLGFGWPKELVSRYHTKIF